MLAVGARSAACRPGDGGRIDHRAGPATAEGAAATDQRQVEAEHAAGARGAHGSHAARYVRRLSFTGAPMALRGLPAEGSGGAPLGEAQRAIHFPRSNASSPSASRRRKHLAAVWVVAEHVHAGAGRATAARRRRAAPVRSAWRTASRMSAAMRARHAGGLPARRRSRQPSLADQHQRRAHGAPPARPAARNPGPCPGRPAISTTGWPRPSSAATVAPTLVPLLSLMKSTSPIRRRNSTRCGSPGIFAQRRSIGPQPRSSAPAQSQRGQRVERVVPAADAQASHGHQPAHAAREPWWAARASFLRRGGAAGGGLVEIAGFAGGQPGHALPGSSAHVADPAPAGRGRSCARVRAVAG